MAGTKEEMLLAVEIVKRHEGIISKRCKAEIDQVIGRPVADATVRRWYATLTKKERERPEAELAASRALDDMFERVTRAYLKRALDPTVVGKATGSQSVLAAATALDKMRLLRGLPTEIVQILPVIILELTKANIDPADYFRITYEKIKAANERNLLSS